MTGFAGYPLALPALYLLHRTIKAAPQCISGRTSYHRVRLAFHSYPQVIRGFFTIHRFGPPVSFTSPSSCPWVAHPASGLSQLTPRPLRTRFRFGFASIGLTSPAAITPRLINQKAHRHRFRLRLPVGMQFQVYFTPLPGAFTFPSRYWFLYRSAGRI